MKICCLRWFCHVLHRHQDAPVLRCKYMMSEEVKRGRDRPQITWKEVISKNLEYLKIQGDLEKDRKQ